MMTYTFQPRGVCSQAMRVEVDDQGIIQKLEVIGGCSGNLQGISALVKGMPAKEAIQRLKGSPEQRRRMGEHNRQAVEKFSTQRVLEELKAVYGI